MCKFTTSPRQMQNYYNDSSAVICRRNRNTCCCIHRTLRHLISQTPILLLNIINISVGDIKEKLMLLWNEMIDRSEWI